MAQKRQLIFVATLLASVWASACGRQVTPNPPGLGAGGAPPGFLAIHFNVSAPFNFSNYQYMVVFNTTGTGPGPSTDTFQTNWAGYSVAAVALGTGVSSSAEAIQFVRNQNPRIPPRPLQLGTTPQTFIYNLNSNGTGTQFSIVALKRVFYGIPSPSPSPSASPSSIWTFNAFTAQVSQGQWVFSDSLGPGGPVDPQFVSPRLCMTEPFDNTYYGIYTPSDPSAQIFSVELSNNPINPTPCP